MFQNKLNRQNYIKPSCGTQISVQFNTLAKSSVHIQLICNSKYIWTKHSVARITFYIYIYMARKCAYYVLFNIS